MPPCITCRVSAVDGVVTTVGKQIQASEITSSQLTVCINESTPFGVIVAGLEVIQPCFSVIDIAAVSQGVMEAKGADQTAVVESSLP